MYYWDWDYDAEGRYDLDRMDIEANACYEPLPSEDDIYTGENECELTD